VYQNKKSLALCGAFFLLSCFFLVRIYPMKTILKKTILPLVLLSFSLTSFAQKQTDRPKLVVGIVIDQMRWDYLEKFSDRYTDKGFKRMLKEGSFKKASDIRIFFSLSPFTG